MQEALEELSEIDPEKCHIVTLRYLLGCTIEETADAPQLSVAKVRRDWVFSKAWLKKRISPSSSDSS